MSQTISTRALERADLPCVANIVDRTGLFPVDMLADMVEPYLTGNAPHHWLVARIGDAVAGFAYVEPERMTEGTFNLLAIAVDPDVQRSGVGKAIIRSLQARLKGISGRVLLVETSALDEFAATRHFYAGQSFVEEARIRDFYSEGEDKIVFWKQL